MYVTLTKAEKEEILNSRPAEKFFLIGHRFVPLKGVGKNYCKGCGLVALHNQATQWCIAKGCRYELHSRYAKAMRNLTKASNVNKAK